MEPDKSTASEGQEPKTGQQSAPADALSMSPDELEEAEKTQAAATPPTDNPDEKKLSPLKKLFRKVNVYFLIFILLVIIVAIIAIVNYLNSTKVTPEPNVATQDLNPDELKQLNNSDATVGNASQTLTIQGNAIIAGQSLLRGNLNVAGNLQTGGEIKGPKLTISGDTSLGQTQINSLQVAQNVAIQGETTIRNLNVAGTSSFSGQLTASQITVTQLTLSGNAALRVPNHISFTGATPSRTTTGSVLGNGGTASINGSDTTGTISINSGNNPTAGCFMRVTFGQVFSNEPHVIISPVGAAAGQLQYYVDRDKTGFSLCTNNAAAANQVFAFDYFITN